MAEPQEIVFGEATRLLARQEADLDTLRVRSLGALSAGGLIAGFSATTSHHHASPSPWALLGALAALAVMAVLTVVIQWPADFDFSHDLAPMIDRLRAFESSERPNGTEIAFNWARDLDGYRKSNASKIKWRYWLFTITCCLLGAEILLVVVSRL